MLGLISESVPKDDDSLIDGVGTHQGPGLVEMASGCGFAWQQGKADSCVLCQIYGALFFGRDPCLLMYST